MRDSAGPASDAVAFNIQLLQFAVVHLGHRLSIKYYDDIIAHPKSHLIIRRRSVKRVDCSV